MKSSDANQSIEQAIEDLKKGKMVILLDDEDRENEGDLIIAAEHATPEAINFMATHGRGLICLTLTGDDFKRLGLPMMTTDNRSPMKTAFGVGFEASSGVTTGISAFDRSHTIAVAIDPESGPESITIPGHVFPLRAKERGVLERAGHTEGATDLARLAGLKASAVLCEIMSDSGHMARGEEIKAFANKHQLTVTTNKALIDYRLSHENICVPGAIAKLPTESDRSFLIQTFYSPRDGQDHVAMVPADLDTSEPVLLRIHSECLTGDVLGSTRCDCGKQLSTAKEALSLHGGVLLYLKQEGRGIGLAEKIKAYSIQDTGVDTVEANKRLGHQADLRDYSVASQILKQLGIQRVRLMTNNPEKVNSLTKYGIDVVERMPIQTKPTKDNLKYLKVKKSHFGHYLDLPEVTGESDESN